MYTVRVSSSRLRPARTRAPRGSLTRERILDAAEDVARDGFEALTLRALAARLDAAPMALYRYFPTKDALVNALLDRVLGRFTPRPPSDDWVDDLRHFARAHRRLLDQHPWALAALFSHPSPGRNATRVGEIALAILNRGGFDSQSMVAIFGGILALNYGWSSFAGARDVPPANAAEQVREALATVPPGEFPHTTAVASDMAQYGHDHHYELVLDRLLAGIRAASRAGPRS